MNKALSKVGEGLIVGVMVAIVGSLTGILWNEYSKNAKEMKLARELLEKQTGGNLQQDLFNDSTNKYIISQKSKNEEILSFIKYQLAENEVIRLELLQLVKSGGTGSTGSVGYAGNFPEDEKDSGRSPASSDNIEDTESRTKYKVTEWSNEQVTLDQMQIQQQALQQNSKEQLQLQHQIK